MNFDIKNVLVDLGRVTIVTAVILIICLMLYRGATTTKPRSVSSSRPIGLH